MGGAPVNDHDIDMHTHLSVSPEGRQTLCYYLVSHTHFERKKWGKRLSLSAIEHRRQEREICQVRWLLRLMGINCLRESVVSMKYENGRFFVFV